VFDACRMGLEGIVSKRREHPYRSARSKTCLKVKNPAAPGAAALADRRITDDCL
jgi:ATP-dependent DNA ligase